ncbi:DUF2779 domain-containing protein [Halioglobus sp. HI00S01]|uniref:DUF2779 domain-containing protein n=1 Tax=Halioglobus sp. HI00S01 TaxID=1822214 RepID=UPI0018D47261|nr:DUF2779 domain-containing protein [Halioglobus sp. HI00S01]
MNKYITKTQIVANLQCPKRLWLSVNAPQNGSVDDNVASRIDDGNALGSAARTLFDGELITGHGDAAIADTLASGSDTVFEGAYLANGAIVRADVLSKVKTGHQLVEIKSATSAKDSHVVDTAIQTHVIRSSGVDVTSCSVGAVDSTWVYRKQGNFDGLIKLIDVTERVEKIVDQVPAWIEGARQTLAARSCPNVEPGQQCETPYPCEFRAFCNADQAKPAVGSPSHSLPKPWKKPLSEFLAQHPQADWKDVADDLLNPLQQRVKWSHISGSKYHNIAGARRSLARRSAPFYFLDFEAVSSPVPLWVGTKPFQQVPFQYSLHNVDPVSGSLSHAEYLPDHADNPVRELAERLVGDLPDEGTIFVYHATFEKGRIKEMAQEVPELADQLLALLPRIVDLLPITRDFYYHPDQGGKWSLKNVLPCVAPELSYADLDGVHNGMDAVTAYRDLLTNGQTEQVRQALLSYCALDTLALVYLWYSLRGETTE